MRHTWSEWSLITAAVICRVRLSSGDRSLPPCMHAGVLVGPGRERWGTRTASARRLTGQDAGPYPWKCRGPKGGRSRRPCAPDTRGERVRPPDSAPYLDPSISNTAPPSRTPQLDEDTRSPVYFGHFNPFGHFILLFLFNKSLSEAWRHTHCVCPLLLPPQYFYRNRNKKDFAWKKVSEHDIAVI